MAYYDKAAIAGRLRALLPEYGEGRLDDLAIRLGVDVIGLHMSLDELAPQPTVEVIAAVVGACGVDPAWLLTGDYSSTVHRSAVDGDRESVRRTIESMGGPAESTRHLWLVQEAERPKEA